MKPTTTHYIYDGQALKAVTLTSDEGWTIAGEERSMVTLEALVNRVPWLARCVSLVAAAAKSVPFAITRGTATIDDSTAWTNALGITANPRRLIEQVARALLVYGNAYIYPAANPAGYVRDLRYWIPSTVEPRRDRESGLVVELRRSNVTYPRERVVCVWPASEQVEDGPAPSSPALSALLAAGVLDDMSGFAARYFQNGAVRVTLLAVKTTQQEAQRIGDWWREFVTGRHNAHKNRVVNADVVEPKTIGDGLEGLHNTELTSSSVQAVAAALGVPQSMLMANAANYATARVDQFALYTTTIIPLLERIADAINEQLFTKAFRLDGYHIEFQPESLDAFHEDEVDRANAYSTYVGAGMLPSIAAQLCGIELPDGVEYGDLDPEDEPTPEPETQPEQVEQQPETEQPEELRRWQRKALRSFRSGAGAVVQFDTDAVPLAEQERINRALSRAQSEDDIKAAFLPVSHPDALERLAIAIEAAYARTD